MKKAITNKKVLENYENVRCCGYCDLQVLLSNHEPVACNSASLGWNYDVYSVYGVTICTGYRNMPGKRLEEVAYYEEKARIFSNLDISYQSKKEEIERLLKEFCLLNEGNLERKELEELAVDAMGASMEYMGIARKELEEIASATDTETLVEYLTA